MNRYFCNISFLIVWSGLLLMGFQDVPLQNTALEARAMRLFEKIGCPVCGGQSLGGSNAELAGDIRNILRLRIAEGYTDEQAIQYLEERYGTSIRLSPAFERETFLLWFLPIVFFMVALWVGYARRFR